MKIAESRITAQGQVSVPAEVRRRLGLPPGSLMEWVAEGDQIFVRRVGRYTLEDVHRALFAEEPEHHELSEYKEGIRRYVKAKHARR